MPTSPPSWTPPRPGDARAFLDAYEDSSVETGWLVHTIKQAPAAWAQAKYEHSSGDIHYYLNRGMPLLMGLIK